MSRTTSPTYNLAFPSPFPYFPEQIFPIPPCLGGNQPLSPGGLSCGWCMPRYSIDELRHIFANSTDFNELFEAFRDALEQQIQDVELYRLLFWNNSLSPDELCLFGEKLAKEFPGIAYDTYMWLASVFEVTYSAYDNFDLAIKYYRKAAEAKPNEPDPYLDACDCYDPDLNIPPIDVLIDFVQLGLKHVNHRKNLILRLARLYELSGDNEQAEYFRRLAEELGADEG